MGDTSDAGAVAARFGFKFQDHVAARFVLQMIRDRRITKVECEVDDDITVFSFREGLECPEYIQVKTTDKDAKWTATELLSRDISDKPTSVAERSLLCDRGSPKPRFRIVAKRAVNKNLLALQDPIDKRADPAKIAKLADSFRKKHPKTVSANSNDLAYWVENTFWEVFPGIDALQALNLQLISELADKERTALSHRQMKQIYTEVLKRVEAAALASRRDKDSKKLERALIIGWFRDELAKVRTDPSSRGTPYRAKAEKFFVELHTVTPDCFGRSTSSYDAQYERKKWRSQQLATYLSRWVVELTLRASELVEVDQLSMGVMLANSLRTLSAEQPIDEDRLFGETLLHAVLRHWFHSEPIACKLFHRSKLGDRVTRNAHIVHGEKNDQLWLGRTKIYTGGSREDLFAEIKSELVSSMRTDVLLEERDTILSLYEPQYLTDNDLGDALQRGTPIDALISVLCLSILVVYESSVLGKGHADNYRDLLIDEVKLLADGLTGDLPEDVNEVRFHLFLVPVEHVSTLLRNFSIALKIP